MQRNPTLLLLFLSPVISFVISLTPLSHYTPQLIALSTILFIVFIRLKLSTIPLISLVASLIVFTSGGLSSPFYFLIYFLLFSASFTISPIFSLLFSLVLVLLLGQTLNNPSSLLSLTSLLFITPLVWLVSRESVSAAKSINTIARDETDFLLWINLKFKTGITTIIDLASQLQSTPLTYTQRTQIKKIKDSAHSLLNSSQKLTTEISNEDGEL
ncbi:hypothetical protein HYV64_04070 [Candidatus Shapirobacteria bacterium]|nr:hypothetical protein [Candidatus Shapirobacteria bacterium]